jgi:hypothetical protein
LKFVSSVVAAVSAAAALHFLVVHCRRELNLFAEQRWI